MIASNFVVCSYIMVVLDDLGANESKPLSREEFMLL
jgi:hypothetical protein